MITSLLILAATLLYHFQKTDQRFYKKFSKFFYVDNLVTSVKNTKEGLNLCNRANNIFNKVSMELAQWGTNDPVLQQSFSLHHSLKENVIKVSGLMWYMDKDLLSILGCAIVVIMIDMLFLWFR